MMRKSLVFIFLIMALMCGSASATPSPFASYSFDTDAGSVAVDTYGANNGTITHGSLVDDGDGGYYLNASTDYARFTIPDNGSVFDFTGQDFAVCMKWVNYEDWSALGVKELVGKYTSSNYQWALEKEASGTDRGVLLRIGDGSTVQSQVIDGWNWDTDIIHTDLWIWNASTQTYSAWRDGTKIGNTTSYTLTGDFPADHAGDVEVGSGYGLSIYGGIYYVDYYNVPLTESDAESISTYTPASKVLYVNGVTGSDAGDGSISSPYATIQKAADQSGTRTVYIESGYYNESLSNLGTNVYFQAVNGSVYMDDSDGSEEYAIYINGGVEDQDNVTFDGFVINDYNVSICVAYEDNFHLYNSTYSESAEGIIIEGASTGHVLNGVTGYNITEHGVHLSMNGEDGTMEYVTLSNIELYNCGHNMIDIQANDAGNVRYVSLNNITTYFTDGWEDWDGGVVIHNSLVSDMTLTNYTAYNQYRPLKIYGANNITVINYNATDIGKTSEFGAGIVLGTDVYDTIYDTNISIIDSNFTRIGLESDYGYLIYTQPGASGGFIDNIRFINCTYSDVKDYELYDTGMDIRGIYFNDTVAVGYDSFSFRSHSTYNWSWYLNDVFAESDLIAQTAMYNTTVSDDDEVYLVAETPNGSIQRMWTASSELPSVEYWTPTAGKHYIGVPETSTWSAGSWITTFSGTYTEEQTEVTGVEVRP